MSDNPTPLIILFDGTCGLCDATVNFLLRRDPAKQFRFAPQQSQIARDLLAKHQVNLDEIDSVVVIEGDRVYLRSNAALRIVMELPSPWPLVGLLVYLPARLRDAAYDFVARHRKQWFKPPDSCRAPTEQERAQFLA